MGLYDHMRGSDNNNSFQFHSDISNCRNIDLLTWDSDSESLQAGDSDRKIFSPYFIRPTTRFTLTGAKASTEITHLQILK